MPEYLVKKIKNRSLKGLVKLAKKHGFKPSECRIIYHYDSNYMDAQPKMRLAMGIEPKPIPRTTTRINGHYPMLQSAIKYLEDDSFWSMSLDLPEMEPLI
jgi:hypothetical protein